MNSMGLNVVYVSVVFSLWKFVGILFFCVFYANPNLFLMCHFPFVIEERDHFNYYRNDLFFPGKCQMFNL